MRANRTVRRCLAVLLAAAAGFTGPGVASAHVTAHGEQLEKGGEGAIVLRVPNESTQDTVRVEVTIPAEYDLTRVRTRPAAGWDAAIGRAAGGRATSITWTARAGSAIPPGDEHYDEFSFTAAPLPTNVDRMMFPTKQIYADGSLANWADERTGGAEPEHPAPVVALAEPSATGHMHKANNQAGGVSRGPTWLMAAPLGGAVLIMVVFGVFALARPRRRNPR